MRGKRLLATVATIALTALMMPTVLARTDG